MSTRLKLVAGVLVFLFGLATLHYVNFEDVEHHTEWADSIGLLPPSFGIGVLGVIATSLGSLLVGWALGARRAP